MAVTPHYDWTDHSDWTDGGDHDNWDDYDDWTDAHTDWDDHDDWADGPHDDWDDHDDTGHLDWDDGHSDWDDYDDTGDVHEDWDDHSDAGHPYIDWTDSYVDWDDHDDWTDGVDHTDWDDHNDTGHIDWSDSHSDWTNHTDWSDGHVDWTNHSDAGGPYLDWTDSHNDWDDHDDWTDTPYSDWFDHDDVGYTDWGDHDDAGYDDHTDHEDDAYADWTDYDDEGHIDWDDYNDHGDGVYTDWGDHDDAGVHLDWSDHCDHPVHSDHDDDGYSDWDDYNDWTDYHDAHGDSAHTDWDDHDDGGYLDWDDVYSDWYDHDDTGGGVHDDWDDHDDTGHLDWDDGHSDWDDYDDTGDPYDDWTNHSDAGSPHIDWQDGPGHADWDDAHTDWGDHDDWDDAHDDWTNHSDAGSPYLDWTDSHSDHTDHDNWSDAPYDDWTNHSDAGSPHLDWTDGHVDWDDHCDTHGDWSDAHDDWSNYTDEAHADHTDHGDDAHTDWDDYSDSGLTCKTQVTISINGIPVGHDTIGVDIWRDALNGIGRWQIILNNQGHKWGATFTPDDPVIIRINGILMMMGYVDDIEPYLEPRGVYTERIKLTGRDFGMDLAQLYLTRDYSRDPLTGVQWLADDVVQDALTAVTSEITYTSLSVAPPLNYEFDRTYLTDGIRDISKLVNYDFYVEDTLPPRWLHFFDIATMGGGAEATAVALQSIAGSATNNILRLEYGEALGFSIKNYLEAHAGDLKDHWTDLNSAAYTPVNVNNSLSDETIASVGQIFLYGKGAIRSDIITAPSHLQFELDFGGILYTYATLDLSKQGTGRYSAYPHMTGTVNVATRIHLEDNVGQVIEFYRNTGTIDKRTDILLGAYKNDKWRWIDFPYGTDTEIKASGTFISDFWQYIAPAVAFDWSNVEHIRFLSDPVWNQNIADFLIIDGLELPDVEVRSIAQVGPPIPDPPGTRMLDIYRPDIKNQVELDAFITDELAKHKDPVETIRITAEGQTGSHYAAQSLTVQAPSSGILVATQYRIFKLHHSVKLSPDESDVRGYDFITEYELVKQTIDAGTQEIDPTRVAFSGAPTQSLMRKIREEQRYRSPRVP